jgi:hypothetical protein
MRKTGYTRTAAISWLGPARMDLPSRNIFVQFFLFLFRGSRKPLTLNSLQAFKDQDQRFAMASLVPLSLA